jgi:hypothetical protein
MFKVKNTRRNVRRSVSPTPDDGSAVNMAMMNFFDAESASAFQKPWLRLERGLRLQKFRQFAEEYPGLTAEEREALCKTLLKANDSRLLNTKQQIQYEDGKIVGIRGLRMTRVGDAAATFKIEATPTRQTAKKRVSKEDDGATE